MELSRGRVEVGGPPPAGQTSGGLLSEPRLPCSLTGEKDRCSEAVVSPEKILHGLSALSPELGGCSVNVGFALFLLGCSFGLAEEELAQGAGSCEVGSHVGQMSGLEVESAVRTLGVVLITWPLGLHSWGAWLRGADLPIHPVLGQVMAQAGAKPTNCQEVLVGREPQEGCLPATSTGDCTLPGGPSHACR